MIKEFLVPEQNLESLEKRFRKLETKARKVGVASPTFAIENSLNERVKNAKGVEFIQRYRKVTVNFTPVQENGWTLVARILHLPEGNVIKSLSSTDLPNQFRNNSSFCVHCGVNRKRNETYVVCKEDKFAQVGSTCLGDYFGLSADKFINQAEINSSVLDAGEVAQTLPTLTTGPEIWPLDYYLGYVAEIVASTGWVSRADARDTGRTATADEAFGLAFSSEPNEVSPQSKELALQAIDWAESLPANCSEFLHNLRVIAMSGAVDGRTIGYAATIVPSFQREQKNKDNRNSEYVGQVGEKFSLTLAVDRVISVYGSYGESFIHLLSDKSGNSFFWKSQNSLDQGKSYMLNGRIKAHQEYKGTKQTVISHCKIKD